MYFSITQWSKNNLCGIINKILTLRKLKDSVDLEENGKD